MAAYEVTTANLATAAEFIRARPRCSVIDLEPLLGLGPAQVWPIVHELENRRQVIVEHGPAGFRFIASGESGARVDASAGNVDPEHR